MDRLFETVRLVSKMKSVYVPPETTKFVDSSAVQHPSCFGRYRKLDNITAKYSLLNVGFLAPHG